MKKATPTPNRFTISIQSWLAKGLALLSILILTNSCDDELQNIGTKKPNTRFKVYYREFDIPASTIQTDSISTNIAEQSPDKFFCGVANDPIFGKTTATIYTQFAPGVSTKIDQTGKTNFQVTGVDLQLVLSKDYYVYGDSTDATLQYTLHEIDDNADFFYANTYTANSTLAFNPTAIASSSFLFKKDSIKDHRARNADANTNDNPYDTIYFQLPISYGEHLRDTALAKGVYAFDANDDWVYNRYKTDSVFRRAFPGFVIQSHPDNNKILSFKSTADLYSTRITLRYSYIEGGTTKNSIWVYYNQFRPGFTNIVTDRSNTALAGLNQINTDFNAPDDYCYLQGATGLYTKLDFSGVRSYFNAEPVDTLLNTVFNSAQLVIETEAEADRYHQSPIANLNFRIVNPETNRFFKGPLVLGATGYIVDPNYAAVYYSAGIGAFLDAVDDEGAVLTLSAEKQTNGSRIYSGFASQFFEYFLRTPEDYDPIINMALVPSSLGKTFNGISFKEDKVKLRVYYTKAL